MKATFNPGREAITETRTITVDLPAVEPSVTLEVSPKVAAVLFRLAGASNGTTLRPLYRALKDLAPRLPVLPSLTDRDTKRGFAVDLYNIEKQGLL